VKWLEFDSLVNARDVGGTPTVDARMRIHHHSFIPERYDRDDAPDVDDVLPDTRGEAADIRRDSVGNELPGTALPFDGYQPSIRVRDKFASTYLSFLNERPESVLGALRAIAYAPGAALVHCAAGKDRTGTAVALSLLLVGAEPNAVIEDYAASSERMQRIIDRLIVSETYRLNLTGRPLESHMTRPETMQAFLEYAESEHGGVEPMLTRIGWTDADTAAMHRKLRG